MTILALTFSLRWNSSSIKSTLSWNRVIFFTECHVFPSGRIIPGSPADRSGLLNIDDRILEINGTGVSDISHSDIVGLVKNSGTSVKLKIARPGK